MKVEIITIGDEILIGQIVDTNSAWMSKEITENGFEVSAITSVGDCKKSIIQSIDIAKTRADVILLTGGVGPTDDDITKQTLCDYFHTKLVFDQDVFEHITQLFAAKEFSMNSLTKAQALVPETCTVIKNVVGTAPILWFERDGMILVSMPGVPFEMRETMHNQIIPLLKERFYEQTYLHKSYLVSGIIESKLNILLLDFEQSLPESFSLAFLPDYGTIKLRLSALGRENKPILEEKGNELKEILGQLLLAETDEPLEHLLGKLLLKKSYTVSTAESCTGGNIARRIASIAGASAYFYGSVVSYSNRIKTDLLRIDPELIAKHGVVSDEVVQAMATNICRVMQTDCAISISGIAGPTGGTPDKPVGTVWICTKTPQTMASKVYKLGLSRHENIQRATNMALLQLIRMLGE